MSEKKPKQEQTAAPAADQSGTSISNAEKENPIYQLANGSEQVSAQNDMHALANGASEQSTKTVSGNPAGAAALIETADKLTALMADDQTEALQLDEATKERYAHLATVLRQYAADNKAFLSTDQSDFPPDVLTDQKVMGQYEVWTDMIYLRKGPDDKDSFNTIIHEISHADNKASEDLSRIKDFHLKWGDKKENSESFLREEADMLLSNVVFELDGEIDGEVLEIIQDNKERPDFRNTHKLKIDMWKSREHKEGSSAVAFEKWESTIDTLNSMSQQDPSIQFDYYSYNKEATKYIEEGGPFPKLAK